MPSVVARTHSFLSPLEDVARCSACTPGKLLTCFGFAVTSILMTVVSHGWPVLRSLGCVWLESGLWVVAVLNLCSGTSSGAVLMQLVLRNPDLRLWEKTSSWMAKDTDSTRSPSELAACLPPVTSSLGYLTSAI